MDDVMASRQTTGSILTDSKSPTPLEASAATPICVQPISADALPILFSKGANANAFAFGFIIPTHERQMKNIPMVLYSPSQLFHTKMKNNILVIT